VISFPALRKPAMHEIGVLQPTNIKGIIDSEASDMVLRNGRWVAVATSLSVVAIIRVQLRTLFSGDAGGGMVKEAGGADLILQL
jgi:hypothetical protein